MSSLASKYKAKCACFHAIVAVVVDDHRNAHGQMHCKWCPTAKKEKQTQNIP